MPSKEHISPKFEHNFIETLVQAKVGILLSWAYIGQGGHGHVNEHSQSLGQPTFQQLLKDPIQLLTSMSRHWEVANSTNFCGGITNHFFWAMHSNP